MDQPTPATNPTPELPNHQRIVLDYLRANPGSSFNVARRGLGWTANALTETMAQLLADDRIKFVENEQFVKFWSAK